MERIEEILKGNGLFIFSDPGGAKPILSLVSFISDKLLCYKIVSDREYSFYREFDLDVVAFSGNINKIVSDFKPDFIFTGTSYTSKIELQFIEFGKKIKIPTYSFVDHWTNIRERFNNNGTEVLPDIICLIDSRAAEIAFKQGLEQDRILITGNPFHEYLKLWKPKIERDEFFLSQGISSEEKKLVIFAPDPLSNVDGLTKFGFDETQVINEMCELIGDLKNSVQFIFKPHPNQNIAIINPFFLENVILADKNIDNNHLIYYGDCILGFFSSYLIEAEIMNKKVLRYLPAGSFNDPFAEFSIGTIINKQSFVQSLLS